MGLFKRNTKRTSEAIEIKPVIAESPIVSVDELEQMVRVVFEEKLELERQLEAAKAELDHSKNNSVKLRAAEEFSRQVKRDNLDLKCRLERAEDDRDSARDKLVQEQSKNAALSIKVKQLRAEDFSRVVAIQRELIDEMKKQVSTEKGGWSKQRILEFLDSFPLGPTMERDA